jgi:hypothetical protein
VTHIPWGTRFCHFYETSDDLLGSLVSYVAAGLEGGDFCSAPIRSRPAHRAGDAIALSLPGAGEGSPSRELRVVLGEVSTVARDVHLR